MAVGLIVEFRLLGDVEAEIDGRIIDLGHLRQRCVLVALLLDANRTVPPEWLLDRVWGEHLPQRARGTLRSYLSRLRQILAPAADVGIARCSSGYVLTVDPAMVDLYRFRGLTEQARAADDDEAAAELFEQALGLWRGEAFSALDTPWLNAVREALAAERLAAGSDRNDIALRLGRHAELLGDLSAAVAADSWNERLAAQLMLALYRCGQQADALQYYEQMRQRLAEELGADPSPPLRQLHRQILAADPALSPPSSAAKASAGGTGRGRTPVPRQLPAGPSSFAGRAADLAQLCKIMDVRSDGTATVVISAIGGSGGIGKTWLALRWAHDNVDRFPDGQLYVNLRGFDPAAQPVPAAVAMRGFLDALGVEPARIPVDPDAQAGLYRSLVAGKRMLIVLDNARDTSTVVPLLPGTATCAVLVTSRHQLAHRHSLTGFRSLAAGWRRRPSSIAPTAFMRRVLPPCPGHAVNNGC